MNTLKKILIVLRRIFFGPDYTIGKLYIDGEYFCDTLEDKVRPDGIKIYGETAIPAGKYKVVLSQSARFKRLLPAILDVPDFKGIRIHAGNTAIDSHGCILVGKNKIKGSISQSRVTENALMEYLQQKEGEIEITIINQNGTI